MSPPSSESKNKLNKTAELCFPTRFYSWYFCLAYSSTLKMEATFSFETLVDFRRATRRYIPEDRTVQSQLSPSQVCKTEAHLMSLNVSVASPLKLGSIPRLCWLRCGWRFRDGASFSPNGSCFLCQSSFYRPCIFISTSWFTSRHEKHYLSPLSGFTCDPTLGRTQSGERECKNDGFVGSRNEIINKVRVLTSVV
jgi:hypothetical protein